jgi:hypothetical protein
LAGSGGETVLLTISVAGAKRTHRPLDLLVPLREPVLMLGMAALTLPVVAGLLLPVFPVGVAGRASEEASRPTMWPCVWRCQRQPLGCLSLPLAPHRATGQPGPTFSSPSLAEMVSCPSRCWGRPLPTSRHGSLQIP